jgi:transposase
MGSSAVVGAMCDAIKLVEAIAASVSWDENQCRLSPGTRVKAMIINILSGRRPLYFVHEFYEDMDLPPLFGRGVKAEDFEDHSLARALDKLSQANAKKVFRSVTLQALTPEQVAIGRLHGDTTSWTLTGVFDEGEDTPPDWLRVTKGYNKDHQPGSKQFVYGLVVTEDRIPLIGDVSDGNTSDKTWNGRILEELSALMTEDQLKEIIYVADSAFITPDNLEKVKPLKFISRLPGNYALETTLKERAWAQDC